jgi:UDP-N-acetylglucosamine 3-dehydrogenase
MEPIRVGIVGMGYMGNKYARALCRIAEATLVGVCDNNPERAASAGRTFEVAHYQETPDLLDKANPGLLFVCGPEDSHVAPSVAALERGISVLVEKPLATTVEGGQQICDAARSSGALLSVGHILRYDTRYAKAKDAIVQGDVGNIQYLYARRWNTRSAQARLKGRSSLPLFLGVHDYDIARWFVESEAVRVYAEGRSGVLAAQGYPIEDTSIALISFANGALACVEEGWIMPEGHPSGFEQRLDVLGDRGMLSVTGSQAGLTIITDERSLWPDTALWPEIGDSGVTGALERELRHVITCVTTGRQPLVSGEDGLAAVRVALAIEESVRRRAVVELSH